MICLKARRPGPSQEGRSAAGTVRRRTGTEGTRATTFDARERAAERRFVLEEEARFHASNRRNRLLAIWAWERMGLTGPAADGDVASFTACAVVTSDETLIARLRVDLAAAGIGVTLPHLRTAMCRCAA